MKQAFDAFELGQISAARLSDIIWLQFCDRFQSMGTFPPYLSAAFLNLPDAVRNVFASHDAEYSVGNAGFYEAATNTPAMLPPAHDAYLALGLPSAAGLIARATELLGLEDFESDTFLDREWSALDAALTDAGFWATNARMSYAVAHRLELQLFTDGQDRLGDEGAA